MMSSIFTSQPLAPPRLVPLWRIRLGEMRGGKPTSLESFRITSKAAEIVEAFSRKYGGEMSHWGGELQVILETNTLDVELFGTQVLSQFYEQWAGGVCTRRCDGKTELISHRSCLCRASKAPAGKDHCSVVTRLIVLCEEVVPCCPGMLTTRSEVMASNFAGMVALVQRKTDGDVPIAVRLRLEMHKAMNRRYPIVLLEPRYPRELPTSTASTAKKTEVPVLGDGVMKDRTGVVVSGATPSTARRQEPTAVADKQVVRAPRVGNIKRGLSKLGIGETKH